MGGSSWEDDKTRSINNWLEGVSKAISVQTEGGEKGTRPKRRSQLQYQKPGQFSLKHRRHLPQQQHRQPTYSSNTPSTSCSIMARPGLRERKPKQPPPEDSSDEEPPASKKKRGSTSRGRGRPRPTQPKSVQFSEQSGGQFRSSYVTSHSHPSTRVQRGALGNAEPMVIFAPLDSEEEKPSEVYKFMRQLVDRLENAVPASLRSHLRAQQIGDDQDQHNDATPEEAKLWEHVGEVLMEANEKLEDHGDENAWTEVIIYLLKLTMGQRGALFKTVQVQTVSIAPPSLIPIFDGQLFAFKKVDAAVVLSKSNREVRQLYQALKKRHPTLHLSQADDVTVGDLCQLATIEVKSPDGSYYGASVQLAIWLAAGLEKMRQLQELAATGTSSTSAAFSSGALVSADGGGDTTPATQLPDSASPLLPYPGISVVGQTWYLHLAIKAADGTVVIYGPRSIGDTTDRSGIFRIVAALETIRSWGEEVYYPWLRDHILMPLAGKTASAPDQ